MGVIPVITHHEKHSLRNCHRPHIVPCTDIRREFAGINMFSMGGHFLQYPIDVELLILHFDCLTANSHASLDKVLRGLHRRLKYDDIADFGLFKRKDGFMRKRYFRTVCEFRGEEVIAHEKCILHRTRWDLEILEKIGFEQKYENECDEDWFDPFLAELGKTSVLFTRGLILSLFHWHSNDLWWMTRCSGVCLQDSQKRLLRDTYLSNAFHAFLALFLFFKQLSLTCYITAVTFRGHVLAERLDISTRYDP